MLVWLLAACGSDPGTPEAVAPEPPASAGPPVLRRLTDAQYRAVVGDLVGPDIPIGNLEPDTAIDGFLSVGAAVSTLSSLGVEQYETAALDVAGFALDATHRDAIVPLAPTGTVDDVAARAFVDSFGRRAWRRPLTAPEADTLVALAHDAATTTGDFYDGLGWALAAILQSPNFLYRVELGEADPDGGRRYTGYELASRLSFLFWNVGPDDELLDAAGRGDLHDPAKLAAQVDRLMADPRLADGLENFFSEWFELQNLDDLQQDPTLFPHMGEDVGPAAREEAVLFLEWIALTHADWRTMATSNTTFVDRKMASMYQIPAPTHEGFGQVELPASGGRRGLLGTTAFLAMGAHPTSTSATLRGKFVRNKLLCQDIPPPPAGVDTSIPEPSGDAPTLRDRVAEHLTDPFCAGCHELTDPIGLGLEHFDALGIWRSTDGGATIDASGDLDGLAFTDAWELGQAVHDHPDFAPCSVEKLFRYGLGRSWTSDEGTRLDWLVERFATGDHDLLDAMALFATSEAFQQVGPVEAE